MFKLFLKQHEECVIKLNLPPRHPLLLVVTSTDSLTETRLEYGLMHTWGAGLGFIRKHSCLCFRVPMCP